MDKLIRGYSADGSVRIFAAITTELVSEAQRIHHTYPVATAALGRTLTAGALMSAGLKNNTDSITIQIRGDGILGGITVVAESDNSVKGYVFNPFADIPSKNGKLDVGGAIGNGTLCVIRDLGLKEPYIGQIPLVSGEIAEDLTYYYAKSEQTPTSIALGVLVNTDNSVLSAGGYFLQLMPEATDSTIDKLENNIKSLPALTSMIRDGKSIEDIVFKVTDGLDMLIENKSVVPKYYCGCSKDKMERALISLGKDELQTIIDEDGKAELSCHFCNSSFVFNKNELERLLESAKKKK